MSGSGTLRLGARLAWVFVGACLTACVASRPPHVVASEFGPVRAGSLEAAGRVSELVDLVGAQVRDCLVSARSEPFEIWVEGELSAVRGDSLYGVQAYTLHDEDGDFRRVHMPQTGDGFERLLAHELTHALLSREWEPLVDVMEEGLCEAVAFRVTESALRESKPHHFALLAALFRCRLVVYLAAGPGAGQSWTFDLSLNVPCTLETLYATPLEHWDRERDWTVRRAGYALGAFLADRLMGERDASQLLELCRRAGGRLAFDEVLGAARLVRGELGPALAPEFDRAALKALCGLLTDSILEAVAGSREARGSAWPAFLRSARPLARLEGSPASIELELVPTLTQEAQRRWPEKIAPSPRPAQTMP